MIDYFTFEQIFRTPFALDSLFYYCDDQSHMSNKPSLATNQKIRVANRDYRKEGFEELENRLGTLMDMLADVLPEEAKLADSIPWRGHEIKDHSNDPEEAATVAQLQAVCFEILNMVEERTALKIRQRRRCDLGFESEQGLWGRIFHDLKAQGFVEFAARYAHLGFTIAPETERLMIAIVNSGESAHLVAQRIWKEHERARSEKSPANQH